MAFYQPESDAFVPTSRCIGPWDPEVQHGGPPAALLTRAAERFGDDAASFVVTRVSVELLRPIRLVPLVVAVNPIRLGRQAQWLQAELTGEGQLVARASIVRVARQPLALPPGRTEPEPVPRGPEGTPEFVFPFFKSRDGYHRAIEVRVTDGEWGAGPCTAWMRPKFPLVAGERSSPLQRAMILADATNGLAPALPFDRFVFINPDLTVHFQRPPRGEWLALAGRSVAEPIGTGLVQGVLFDQHGEVGRCLQSLVVRPR